MFAADFFGTGDDTSPGELYDSLANIFSYLFLDLDTAKSYKTRVTATSDSLKLAEAVRDRAIQTLETSPTSWLKRFVESFLGHSGTTAHQQSLPAFGKELLARLIERRGRSVEDTVWEIVSTQAMAVAPQAQAWAQMISMYLSDEYKQHWPEIVSLSQTDSPEAFDKLQRYVFEAFRLFPGVSSVLRVSPEATTLTDGTTTMPIPAGSQILCNLIDAGRDPNKFPDPLSVKLDRPIESYLHYRWGPHLDACLDQQIVTTAGAAMLRIFARECPNVRRAPGLQGEMKSQLYNGAFPVYLSEDGGSWKNFPVAQKVLFDVVDVNIQSICTFEPPSQMLQDGPSMLLL